MSFLAVAIALACANVAAALVPTITWASTPTYPGETLVLHGAFEGDCAVNLTTTGAGGGSSLSLTPLQSADWSLKVGIPSALEVGAYSVTVVCPSGTSEPRLINAAEVWWFQGDVGNASTAGGWLRILGPVLRLSSPAGAVERLEAAIRDVRDAMTQPIMAADLAWADDSLLAVYAAQLISLRSQLAAARAADSAPITVRLSPTAGGAAAYILAAPSNASLHSAHFALPASLPLGDYFVAVANGHGPDNDANAPAGSGTFTSAAFFESAFRPDAATISVQAPKRLPPGVFVVTQPADPCILPCQTSDESLAVALAAAAAAGGGTVFFPCGRYYLSQPIVVPPNTVLAGEDTTLTSVWFAEANRTTAPLFYIQLNDTAAFHGSQAPALGAAAAGSGLASWGLVNFTLYITAFHNQVILVSNRTDGFLMSRMRLRINPFAFTWGPYQESRGRMPDFNVSNLATVLDLHGVNHVVVDNDIWGAAMLIGSWFMVGEPDNSNFWPNWRRGHAYSYIARNTLWNGQASHYMQLWRQVLFERNVITGATEAAGGQSLGTGPMGGMAQHIYHADNLIRFTWGGDREVMTYDDAGGAYYGPLASVEPGENGTSVVTLAGDAWPASDWEMGGWFGAQIYVINGTGQTQIRRVVQPGVGVEPSPTNRTWVIASPFEVTPDLGASGSWVEIMPFRGRNIFFRNYNGDTGPFQFYGHGVQNLVTGVKFDRVRGMIGWAQWRGWIPPPPVNETGQWTTDPRGELGGAFGNGLQPNVQNIHRSVSFLEGNHLVNYMSNQSGYVEFWGGAAVVLYPVETLNPVQYPNAPHSTHIGILYRDVTMASNGGFLFGNGTADVVVEGAVVNASGGACVAVQPSTSLIYLAPDIVCT
jgi:hypothetical protein